MTTIGILGAGKVGTSIGRLAVAAGYDVLISGSGPASKIQLIIDVLVPGATAVTTPEAIDGADLVILALPLGKHRNLPADRLRGKLVIDAMNYWEPTDGPLPEITDADRSSTEIVAEFLPGTRFVRSLNHIGYHELESESLPAGTPGRHGMAISGDEADAVAAVSQFIDAIGFEPVYAGPLSVSDRFGANTPIFGMSLTRDELVDLLKKAETPEDASAIA